MATSSMVAVLALLLTFSLATSASVHESFLQCLGSEPSTPLYTPNTSSYTSVLQFSVRNFRFSTSSTPKPDLIVTPLDESQVQAVVVCSRKHGLMMKIRSGGHDYEGLSYVSDVPFIILDLINLDSISVDANKGTAWVQSGASIGQLYYRIAEKSRTYGFPAGVCTTMGVGGHFSGGGYGSLMRKYGVAADHIIDARIVNVDGKILDRRTMGKELFWAIRGGGGSSFGVVLSWKIRLVPVPPTLTVFRLFKTLEQGATTLLERWQYVAHKLPREIFFQVLVRTENSTDGKNTRRIQASFQSVFLGKAEKLVPIMEQHFPELGLKQDDCIEMSWIQSTLWLLGLPADGSLEVLLNRSSLTFDTFKAKTDYVTEPISVAGIEGVWKFVLEQNRPLLLLTAYGGRMSKIPESSIPFPHRKGNLYKLAQVVYWEGEGTEEINWIRRLNRYLTPYVSKSPRATYVNYNDLDLGQSKNGTSSYSAARAWGNKYFKNNFDRLVKVKTKVDPDNFFRNAQSIPTSVK